MNLKVTEKKNSFLTEVLRQEIIIQWCSQTVIRILVIVVTNFGCCILQSSSSLSFLMNSKTTMKDLFHCPHYGKITGMGQFLVNLSLLCLFCSCHWTRAYGFQRQITRFNQYLYANGPFSWSVRTNLCEIIPKHIQQYLKILLPWFEERLFDSVF